MHQSIRPPLIGIDLNYVTKRDETSEVTKPQKVTRVYILDGDEGERHACPIPGSLEEYGWCEIDRDVSRNVGA